MYPINEIEEEKKRQSSREHPYGATIDGKSRNNALLNMTSDPDSHREMQEAMRRN